jgi:hypothetical protein
MPDVRWRYRALTSELACPVSQVYREVARRFGYRF